MERYSSIFLYDINDAYNENRYVTNCILVAIKDLIEVASDSFRDEFLVILI